jgi:hypothetical protein
MASSCWIRPQFEAFVALCCSKLAYVTRSTSPSSTPSPPSLDEILVVPSCRPQSSCINILKEMIQPDTRMQLASASKSKRFICTAVRSCNSYNSTVCIMTVQSPAKSCTSILNPFNMMRMRRRILYRSFAEVVANCEERVWPNSRCIGSCISVIRLRVVSCCRLHRLHR